MTDEIVNIDVKDEIQRSESIWKLIVGHIGIGKTLYMTGEVLQAISEYKIKVVITNYDLYGLPDGVQIFKTGSVRRIMERMIENYDETTKKSKVPMLIVIDEINNTLSSKQAVSNISTWITTIASTARKYGVKAFYFSTQGRKQADYRLRVNVSYPIRPTGTSDVDGHPLANWWEDLEEWETDSHRSERDYEFAVLLPSPFTVEFLQGKYNTAELVPIDLNPSVKEEELSEVMAQFLAWCEKKEIVLEGFKRTDVKDFIKRWNHDEDENVIPYSPTGCEVIFSECVRLGYIEPKEDKIEVAEEPLEQVPVESQVESVVEVVEKPEVPSVVEKVRGQTGFCCGQLQTNLYKHRGTKKHLKSVETGVKTVVQNEKPGPD